MDQSCCLREASHLVSRYIFHIQPGTNGGPCQEHWDWLVQTEHPPEKNWAEPALTPSRRQCPYGHSENHFRSYSAKSLVLKLRTQMRALTASKDPYKLKCAQTLCVNRNIFVTVVPWSCMVFKNIPTRVKKSNSYILLIMSHNPAHQDAPTSQGTQPTPTVPPIALVYAFRYVLSTI